MLPWISKIKASKTVVAFFAVLAVFVYSYIVPIGFASITYAQDADTFGAKPIQETIVLSGMDIRVIVVRIINVALGLLGIITLGLILYAGFLIMTSGGEENKVTQGKKILMQATIGLAIILSAFAIVQFIFKMLTGGGDGAPSGEVPPGLLTFNGSGALGKVVKDHYPFRDQTDVARNTSIVVTFGIPIDPSSVAENTNRTCWNADMTLPTTECVTLSNPAVSVSPTTLLSDIKDPYYGDCIDTGEKGIVWSSNECDHINSSTIVFGLQDILDVSGKNDATLGLDAAFLASYENVSGATGPELYTIVIKPFAYLGSAVEEMWYTVDLRKGINMKDGKTSIFVDQWSTHYYWDFKTGTHLDLSPPHITSVYPKDGDLVPKNTILQINFDEAIDPTMVSGYFSNTSNFNNILVNNMGTTDKMVTGTWKITNGYKTVEFVTDNPCGQNSCGETIFCLRVDNCTDAQDVNCTNPYSMLVRTAEPTNANDEAPFEAKPFSGVYDLAFNGLDNDSDNLTSKKLTKPASGLKVITPNESKPDNYWWNFFAKNEIDRSAPYIMRTIPGVDTEDVEEHAPLEIQFSKLMWINTLGMPNMDLNEYPANMCADGTNTCVNDAQLDDMWHVTYAQETAEKTVAMMKHREFGPNDLDLYYFPTVSSTVKSITQNCMYPGYGPWNADKSTGKAVENLPLCIVDFDANGDSTQIGPECVSVNATAASDTGCVYTDGTGKKKNIPVSDFVGQDIAECVTTLENPLVSPYTYK
ncbi:MAG: hypothetical protein HYV41_02535 [Candidatus Magasanikbacteria bacterium]|nr:hypothetical protein [Candidatus Magasanikbacteria bacterium]